MRTVSQIVLFLILQGGNSPLPIDNARRLRCNSLSRGLCLPNERPNVQEGSVLIPFSIRPQANGDSIIEPVPDQSPYEVSIRLETTTELLAIQIPPWARRWEIIVCTSDSLDMRITTTTNAKPQSSMYELGMTIGHDQVPRYDSHKIHLREFRIKPSSPGSQIDLGHLGNAIDLIEERYHNGGSWSLMPWKDNEVFFYFDRKVEREVKISLMAKVESRCRMWIIFRDDVSVRATPPPSRSFQTFADDVRIYSCMTCHTFLARHEDLISKGFTGRHGRAYLFNAVENIKASKEEERVLLTGLHSVADISCNACQTPIGWKYVYAFEESQKYKEGKYIIEKARIAKENQWDND